MDKHEELLSLIKENPELPVVPMVDYEVCQGDDFRYWMGGWGKCKVNEYWSDDERIYFRDDDEEDLIQKLIDDNYEDSWKDKTDEEQDVLAKEIVNNYEWVKCISVYIGLPD